MKPSLDALCSFSRWAVVSLLAAGLSLSAGQVAAAVPEMLSFQGKLNQSGAPVSGNVAMTFKLYTAASGGTALWSETQTVTVADGAYAVLLGSVTPFNLAFDVPYYLGVQVGAEAEMSPRVELAAAPYALMAKKADMATMAGSVASVTVGSDGAACVAGKAGALRWDATTGMQFCDGTKWSYMGPKLVTYVNGHRNTLFQLSGSADPWFAAVPDTALTFTKKFWNSKLRITYSDNWGISSGLGGICIWRVTVNGTERPIEGTISTEMGNDGYAIKSSAVGILESWPGAGTHTLGVNMTRIGALTDITCEAVQGEFYLEVEELPE